MPAALWERLTEPQRDTLLVHELAHLRRGDHWVRRLELLVMGLYWWHPVVWWARREIQEAEEQCCDAWVVWALPDAAHAYATALVETVAFLSLPRPMLPLGASGVGHTHSLKRRLTMILKGTTPRALTWTALGALLVCGALFLPLGPTWVLAQAPDPQPGEEPATTTAPAADVFAPAAAAPHTARTDRLSRPAALTAARGRDVQDVEEAKDEVELLKAQLEGKKAELQEARALLEKARRSMNRADQLGKRGAVAADVLDELRTDLEVRQARVQGKMAQIREAELRLRQASHRLSRLQGRGPHAAGAVQAPSFSRSPTGLETAPAQPPGATEALGAIGGTAAPPRAQGAGDTRLLRSPPAAPRDAEQRLRDLEKKLDRLLREVDALRREMRRQRDGESPAAAPPSDTKAAPATSPGEELPQDPALPRVVRPSTSPARP